MNSNEKIKNKIHELVTEYYQQVHEPRPFEPGNTRVQYGGRVYDEQELRAAVDACLDFWLTAGPRTELLEKRLAATLGTHTALVVNSGSSANLIAMSALCSRRLDHPLEPGDEVITPAMGFPTTVAPIVQNQLVPVFVDCELGTYNIDVSQLEAALSDRTRAIFFAHAMGNPADMESLLSFAQANNLYVIEDACDALGSTYDGQQAGSFGDLGTVSFYAAHHITTGEGGAVFTSNQLLTRICRSLRDWGRDCSCTHTSPPEGKCGHRFDWKIPGLDESYDHRYLFVEVGYNMKMMDIQAAIGLVQLERLPDFTAARKQNFARLYEALRSFEEYLILPRWSERADPSWFAFPITVRSAAPFTRRELIDWLENRNIETRLLFAGNIVRHPGYSHIRHRSVGELPNSDTVLKSSFFVGVYPGLDDTRLQYMIAAFTDFFAKLG